MLKIKYSKDICKETETNINLVIFRNIKNLAKFDTFNNFYNGIEVDIKFVDNSTCEVKFTYPDCKITFEQIVNITIFVSNGNNLINMFTLKPLKKIKSGKELEGLFEISKNQCLK